MTNLELADAIEALLAPSGSVAVSNLYKCVYQNRTAILDSLRLASQSFELGRAAMRADCVEWLKMRAEQDRGQLANAGSVIDACVGKISALPTTLDTEAMVERMAGAAFGDEWYWQGNAAFKDAVDRYTEADIERLREQDCITMRAVLRALGVG